MEHLDYYTDQARPEVRIEFAIAEAEHARRMINANAAAEIVAVHSVLEEARLSPEVFIGPHAIPSNREHVEFAERAAIADLAVRLAVSENTIRSHEAQALTMIARTPRTWEKFRWGEVSPANARTVAELAASLPDASGDLFAQFDAAVADHAERLAPARFRSRARVVRERLVADSAAERHRCRREERRVVLQPDVDGMAWLSTYLPAEVAVAAMARLDAGALSLSANPAETRTMGQLRSDILSTWLTGTTSDAPVGVRVGILVPVMTLLGLSEQPASLEGYGPIDAATARRLTAYEPSFYRILTDPITGTVLDLDKATRYIPAGMRRMRQLIDQTCTFPGCGRLATGCDLDHTIDLQYGGTTKLTNLAHLCRNHHRDKHQTRWTVTQATDGTIRWTSPTGYTRTADPPPF